MAGEKTSAGGWRSRFGAGKKSQAGGDAAENLSRDRDGYDDEREMAAQQIARQQRAANGVEGSNKLAAILGVMNGSPSKEMPPYPAPRLETNRVRDYGDMGGQSKADRLMGESSRSTSDSSTIHSKGTSASDIDDETSCPVCLELLSFRLAGEKPQVTPLCGHALHHACFTAVYGSPESIIASQNGPSRAPPPGMCGVCRTLIQLGDEGESRRQNSESFLLLFFSNLKRRWKWAYGGEQKEDCLFFLSSGLKKLD